MDIIKLSNNDSVQISVIDYEYFENDFYSSFMVRVVFDEDEFSFTYDLKDNEEINLNDCDEAEDLICHIMISKEYTRYDLEIIKDAIESEVRLIDLSN